MNVRTVIVVTLAVVCGLSAMILVNALRKPPSGPVIEKVGVVYAAADLKPGETIGESMIELRQVPKADVPEDAVLKITDALDRAAMAQIDKGDMIRNKKLAEKGAGRGMSALIKTGMRAFTIQTPSFSSSLAGFLLPGNRVDVLMTADTGNDGDGAGPSTVTLLQNVEILAVHTTVNTPTANKIDVDQARSVTLLVTPDDASLLDLGQNKGTLHLSLRNLNDTGSTKPKPTTLEDLGMPRITKPEPVVVQVPAPAPPPPPPPAPEPLPVFESQEPELVKIDLAVRTLRGTHSGQDILSMMRPAPTANGNRRTVPGAGPITPTGIARIIPGGWMAGAPATQESGPPP